VPCCNIMLLCSVSFSIRQELNLVSITFHNCNTRGTTPVRTTTGCPTFQVCKVTCCCDRQRQFFQSNDFDIHVGRLFRNDTLLVPSHIGYCHLGCNKTLLTRFVHHKFLHSIRNFSMTLPDNGLRTHWVCSHDCTRPSKRIGNAARER